MENPLIFSQLWLASESESSPGGGWALSPWKLTELCPASVRVASQGEGERVEDGSTASK